MFRKASAKEYTQEERNQRGILNGSGRASISERMQMRLRMKWRDTASGLPVCETE